MHIVFINPVAVIGGAERVFLACIQAVRAEFPDARLTALLLAYGPLEERVRELGVDCLVHPMPATYAKMGDTQFRKTNKIFMLLKLAGTAALKIPGGYRYFRKLSRTLKDLRPTLVHSHGLKSHFLAALACPKKTNILWHIHDYYSQRPLMVKILKRVVKNVSVAIAISESVSRDVTSVFPDLPVHVVYNCVDQFTFCPVGCSYDLPGLVGIPEKESALIRIGIVATYANWKGQDLFLQAIARLKSRNAKFYAYIVGGAIYSTPGSQFTREELVQKAATLGVSDKVGFVSFQSNSAAVYRALDIVVHASTRPEPFGLTIIEAMACARPVVISRAGGAAELFTDGIDALGFEPNSADDLAEKLSNLIENKGLRSKLAEAALKTVLQNFSSSRFGYNIRVVYTNLLSERS
ncbi:glycosyltransferase family 4 protein [Telmatocola sphagniphila]|uniref:Glycosyltransferase family 4 protein n=1 Tax=Telmatocola sphagniphila TaxID=1123043 RepID=A0A8E6EWH1_9BACT|nr:glycosyltransferase family 4 protein [Telmatocola sphagniphila]QVL33787.1 glycosyltransferase family 4 protein [Telmatocola sphagniphila]